MNYIFGLLCIFLSPFILLFYSLKALYNEISYILRMKKTYYTKRHSLSFHAKKIHNYTPSKSNKNHYFKNS